MGKREVTFFLESGYHSTCLKPREHTSSNIVISANKPNQRLGKNYETNSAPSTYRVDRNK